MARSSPKPSAVTIATQQAEALKHKLAGLTVRQIAEEMDLPPSTVQDRVTGAMTELVQPLADEVRLVELARLDDYTKRLVARMDEGDEAAERIVPVLLKVQERRARYLGLDAPERVEQTTTLLPTADPAVEALLAEGREALG